MRRTASENNKSRFEKNAEGFFDKLGILLRKSLTNSFVVERKGKEILSVPVLIMLIILCSMFYFTVVAVVIGLFLDCKYSIEDREKRN